jgi:hypothetical protein
MTRLQDIVPRVTFRSLAFLQHGRQRRHLRKEGVRKRDENVMTNVMKRDDKRTAREPPVLLGVFVRATFSRAPADSFTIAMPRVRPIPCKYKQAIHLSKDGAIVDFRDCF